MRQEARSRGLRPQGRGPKACRQTRRRRTRLHTRRIRRPRAQEEYRPYPWPHKDNSIAKRLAPLQSIRSYPGEDQKTHQKKTPSPQDS
ncbi:MAG TPA: hypothetical protein DEB40_08210 [Elusimicrobia bacterium]|nr:hypothetical protein [Elusimicrobiota bacterium]HBT61712.1 hypothetical protein [Elusimicrobiota bacterium]